MILPAQTLNKIIIIAVNMPVNAPKNTRGIIELIKWVIADRIKVMNY